MGLSNNQKKKLLEFRKWAKSEKRRKRLSNYPSFSFGVDERTNNIIYRYSINEVVGFNKKSNVPILKNKKKNGYTFVKLNQYKNIKVNSIYNSVKKDIQKHQKIINKNVNNFPHWVEEYTTQNFRFGNEVGEKSLSSDKYVLDKYLNWIINYHPKYLDIYHHIEDGKSILEEYLIYIRNSKTKFDKHPTKNTLSNHYRRIKGFFNWVSYRDNRFPYNMLKIKGWGQERNKDKLPPSLSESDFITLSNWMKDNQNNKYEKHFRFFTLNDTFFNVGCR